MDRMQSEVHHDKTVLQKYAAGLHLCKTATWRDVDQKLRSMPADNFLAHPDDIREQIEHELGRPISLAQHKRQV